MSWFSIRVWWVTKLLALPPPPHPCQLRSGPSCLVSITAAMHSTEYRIFVYSVNHCIPGTENTCWIVYVVWLASFYCSPPTTMVSFPAWGHPPAENPSHTRQSSSSQIEKNVAFQSLVPTYPPVSSPVTTPLARKAHERAHGFPLSSASLLLSLFFPLQKVSGPTFALANTHQTVPRLAEIDGLCTTNCSFLSVPSSTWLSLQSPIIIPFQSIFCQTSGKVSILFLLVSGTQQALSKCSQKWNENTV